MSDSEAEGTQFHVPSILSPEQHEVEALLSVEETVEEALQLGGEFYGQFEETGQLSYLEMAITLFQALLEMLPTQSPRYFSVVDVVAHTHYTRFERTGQLSDLEEAVGLYREMLDLRSAPHPDRDKSLNDLAHILETRFRHVGQISDLEEAIELHRDTLSLRPNPHPDRSQSLNNLACTLNTRVLQTGQLPDIEEAIALHREALSLRPASHPDRSNSLSNFATILSLRFGQTGQVSDLEEAVGLHYEALALRPPPHPDRAVSLNNTATILDIRFDQTGQISDLEEAIKLFRQALTLFPAPHAERSGSLSNLGSMLHKRFGYTGQLSDLEEAIGLHREALSLRPAPHPYRPTSLNNLAIVLETRFGQAGHLSDIEEAVEMQRQALALFPAPHPRRSTALNNLAVAIDTRFERTGQLFDLEEAAGLHREALVLRPTPHPDRSSSLNNLASVLSTRFSENGQLSDLQEAVELHREALILRPVPHPDRSMSLNNLAIILRKRFGEKGQLSDLEEAIGLLNEALSLVAEEHPANCAISSLQGRIYIDLSSYTQKSKYFNDAMAAFRMAAKCETARVSDRIKCALRWASCADGNHDSALEAYQYAIDLLPRMATLALDLHSRQQSLISRSDGLARNAAACAIRCGNFGKAIEFLEGGRNIFWSQALQLRTPLDKLRTANPDLAKKVQDISRALERGSFRDISTDPSYTSRRISVERETTRIRLLYEDWLATLKDIRKLDDFHDFLLPKSLDTLQRAACNGPIVMLNAGLSRCDALIMTSAMVSHISLPDITYTVAESVARLLQSALASSELHISIPSLPGIIGKVLVQQMQDDKASEILQSHMFKFNDIQSDSVPGMPDVFQSVPLMDDASDMLESNKRKWHRAQSLAVDHETILRTVCAVLWITIVEPVIKVLSLEKTDSPTRLWWCPTGPFTFLPLHAAGFFSRDQSISVADYVISSYTPTLNALLTPAPLPLVPPNFKMAMAIQPKDLPYTRLELLEVEENVPDTILIKLGAGDLPASVKNVLLHLSDVSIAHFACHGHQNMVNPLWSGLMLDDGEKLTVSQLMEKSMPKAALAFLSACETAMGDETLPDEALHIAASMLFVGFRGVVATMWEIDDEDGPKIAGAFYRHLFWTNDRDVDHPPDTTQAARALHLAVKELREERCSLRRWVPFIHLGL